MPHYRCSTVVSETAASLLAEPGILINGSPVTTAAAAASKDASLLAPGLILDARAAARWQKKKSTHHPEIFPAFGVLSRKEANPSFPKPPQSSQCRDKP